MEYATTSIPRRLLRQRWLRVVALQCAGIVTIGAGVFAVSSWVSGGGDSDSNANGVHHSATSAMTDAQAHQAVQAEPADPTGMPADAHKMVPSASETRADVQAEHAPMQPALVSAQPAASTNEHAQAADAAAHAPAAAPVNDAAAPPPTPMEHPQEPMPAAEATADGHAHEAPAAPVDATCAADYVETVRATTKRFEDFDVAVAEGYYKSTPGNVVAHYANRAYIRDGVLADPAKPEVLMYVNTRSGMRLAGIMYLGLPGVAHPEICSGTATWHTHPEVCITDAGMVVGFSSGGTCSVGRPVLLPEMLHVWLVPNPAGVFDEHMDPEWLRDQFA
jgi:hypothetical protein